MNFSLLKQLFNFFSCPVTYFVLQFSLSLPLYGRAWGGQKKSQHGKKEIPQEAMSSTPVLSLSCTFYILSYFWFCNEKLTTYDIGGTYNDKKDYLILKWIHEIKVDYFIKHLCSFSNINILYFCYFIMSYTIMN